MPAPPKLKDIERQPHIKRLRFVKIVDKKLSVNRVTVTVGVAYKKLRVELFEFFLTETEFVSPLHVKVGVARIVKIIRIACDRRRKIRAENRIF